MREPDDFRVWKGFAQSGNGGKCMHDVAERTEAQDQEARLRHAEPCGRIREVRAWNGFLGRRRWRHGCRDERRWRARERSPSCNPFLLRERPGRRYFEERFDARLTKEDDVIHGAKRGDEKSTCIFIKDGTAGAFQRANAQIRVHSHDENVPFVAGAFEIADVADVKRIEAAVGKNNALTMLFMLR